MTLPRKHLHRDHLDKTYGLIPALDDATVSAGKISTATAIGSSFRRGASLVGEPKTFVDQPITKGKRHEVKGLDIATHRRLQNTFSLGAGSSSTCQFRTRAGEQMKLT
jgi:hypothetical protein